ncbi:MAG TPA: hypothetical protein VIE65_04960, partial [Methylobacter sp.]
IAGRMAPSDVCRRNLCVGQLRKNVFGGKSGRNCRCYQLPHFDDKPIQDSIDRFVFRSIESNPLFA